MANEEHLKILKQGVGAWNRWHRKYLFIRPDLSEANLSGADLIGVDLSDVNLRRANLTSANLSEADLRRVELRRADLRRAYLIEANLSSAKLSEADLRKAALSKGNLVLANLSEADLRQATLFEANLDRADLSGADLSEANVGWTTFGAVDLSAVKGLDTVKHFGPSTIGIDTIYRSKGNIPEVFLRGAGVPDTFITQISSLVEKVTQYYSCFISHSSKDKSFCDRLYADLKGAEVLVYYFPEDARWGETVWGEIDRSIRNYDKVVVICSENSLQSGPVLREIERALQRENQEDKNILFPIRIDNYLFDVWEHPRKADVVSKVVGDFRGWDRGAAKHKAAFEKLLRALEAES